MKGIRNSTGFDRFEGYAPAWAQNYDSKSRNKRNVILSRPDGTRKAFTVNKKTAKKLEERETYFAEQEK